MQRYREKRRPTISLLREWTYKYWRRRLKVWVWYLAVIDTTRSDSFLVDYTDDWETEVSDPFPELIPGAEEVDDQGHGQSMERKGHSRSESYLFRERSVFYIFEGLK